MAGITQSDILLRLANLRGMTVVPNGENADWKRYIQDAFNYAWRYYPWTASKKTVTVNLASDPHLPGDFDLEGWRLAVPPNTAQRWTELLPEDYAMNTGSYAYTLEWDFTTGTYKVIASNGPTITFTYQVVPPTVGDAMVPFPDAMTIAMGANIWAKYGANPTSADAQQQWDMFHAMLDRVSSRADKNRPRNRVMNLYDLHGTYPGDTR